MRAGSFWRKDTCTSMTEAEQTGSETQAPARETWRAGFFRLVLARLQGGARFAPILPPKSIAGRALVLVIAIMTFLAGLAAGAVHLVADASSDWSGEIAREVTIQIRPMPGRDIEADVKLAADLAGRVRGIEAVRVFGRAEGEKLLEPWLGAGLDLSELPVPRLIVLRLASGARPDFARLRGELGDRVPNAGLDDHRLWLGRLRTMADTLVLIGLAVLTLVVTATGLAVAFATRGAMAGTAQIIDVLHLVGAEDSYIAAQFQRHFLRLGLRGAAIGGALAVLFYLLFSLSSAQFATTPGAGQIEALFGRFALPATGYVSIAMIGLVVSAVTAIVSRATVYRTLSGQE